MLRNPYYVGTISYAGKTYPGRHEPLVDEATFQEVQDLLESKRVSGERPWRHFHYLRGSIYCRECGRRLIYSQAKGHGGNYDYFICGGRQHANCSQKSHRVEAVEAAVERHYATVQLSYQEREDVRAVVKKHATGIAKLAEQKISEAERQLSRLDSEERKLLTAHYADQISESLFSDEQKRISRERIGATKQIEQLSLSHERVLDALNVALALTDNMQAAYCQASPQERRLLNQAFFERLEIDGEEVAGNQLAAPFADLLNLGHGWSKPARLPNEATASSPGNAETPRPYF
jgi:hypothetical protein